VDIALIGVGNMGRPMLANLLKKGFSATAYDIVPAALDGAVALGAARAGSPAEAAAAGDMVITILPSSGNVEAAYLGAGGIIEGVAPSRLCIELGIYAGRLLKGEKPAETNWRITALCLGDPSRDRVLT
jgi:3-hydroxyisobutyrate dehydrogenase